MYEKANQQLENKV